MLSRLPMNLFQDNFYDEHLINMEILTCIENENLEELKNIIESYQTSHLIDLSYEEGLFYIRAAQNNRYDVLNYLCNKNKELAKKYSYEMLTFALTDNKEDCIKYIIQNLEPDYSPLKQTRYKNYLDKILSEDTLDTTSAGTTSLSDPSSNSECVVIF